MKVATVLSALASVASAKILFAGVAESSGEFGLWSPDATPGTGLPGTFGKDYSFIDEKTVDIFVDEHKVRKSHLSIFPFEVLEGEGQGRLQWSSPPNEYLTNIFRHRSTSSASRSRWSACAPSRLVSVPRLTRSTLATTRMPLTTSPSPRALVSSAPPLAPGLGREAVARAYAKSSLSNPFFSPVNRRHP